MAALARLCGPTPVGLCISSVMDAGPISDKVTLGGAWAVAMP